MPRIQLSQSAPSRRCAGGNGSAAASCRRQGIGEGLEGKSTLILSEMIRITALAPLRCSHGCSLPSLSGNTEQILLTSVWPTCRAVAEGDGQPVHDSFSLFSFSLLLFFPLSFPPTPLRQRRTKGEAEEKQYNLLALICGAHQSMSGLRHGFACPLKALIFPLISAKWFSTVTDAQLSICHSDTRLFSVGESNWLCLDGLSGCLNKVVTWMLMWVLM